jgi:hypothetical protein
MAVSTFRFYGHPSQSDSEEQESQLIEVSDIEDRVFAFQDKIISRLLI